MTTQRIDMTGNRYNSLVAIKATGSCKSGDLKWLFLCDCGNEFDANGYSVRSGRIIDCPKCAKERVRQASLTHGLTDTREFKTWTDIQTRCINPNSTSYKNYGGRGIKVCKRWLDSFENFLTDMGKKPSEKHSIDRINNNGDYEPSNCKWANHEEQAANKRNSIKICIGGVTKSLSAWSSHYGCSTASAYFRHRQGLAEEDIFLPKAKKVEHNGIRKTISEWSKQTGIKATTLSMRINHYGWTVERALTEGVKKCA